MKANTIFLFKGQTIKVPSQQEQQFNKICKDFESMVKVNYDNQGKKFLYYYKGNELNQELQFKDLSNFSNELTIQVDETQIQNNNNNNIIQRPSPIQNNNNINKIQQHTPIQNNNNNNIIQQPTPIQNNNNKNIVNQPSPIQNNNNKNIVKQPSPIQNNNNIVKQPSPNPVQPPVQNNQLNINQISNQNINLNNNNQNIILNQNKNNNQIQDKNIKKLSKDITCPTCHEKCKIEIKDYKIKLYDCKNKHSVDDILLNEYEETQQHNDNISNELKKEENDIKIKFNKFASKINNLINSLKSLKENMEIYYNICNNFNGNGNIEKDKFIKDLEKITVEISFDKFMETTKIYDKMQSNGIYITYIIDANRTNNLLKVFGSEFVRKNKDNCSMKIGQNKYNLSDNVNITNYNGNKYTLELIGINNLTDISDMFCDCSSLEYLDISKWNTNKITNMSSLFYGCKSLNKIIGISNLNTSNVTDMSYMFYGCESLEYLSDLSKWDTSNTTKMNHMFSHCTKLKILKGISEWNTSNVTNMENMFHECSSLSSLPDLSKWDTTNVTDMSWMFAECEKLQSIVISNWDTNQVKDMSYMFCFCSKLESLPDISKWKTDNVTDMSWMFFECKSLKNLPDLKNWKDSGKELSHMFDGCTQILQKYHANISRFIK